MAEDTCTTTLIGFLGIHTGGNVGKFLCYKTKKTPELGGVLVDAAW
jgi:hypothetical protein